MDERWNRATIEFWFHHAFRTTWLGESQGKVSPENVKEIEEELNRLFGCLA
jgi:hypothetical protein